MAAIAAAVLSRADSTRLVWMPMSFGPDSYQRTKPADTASRPATLRRSAPVAVTSAIASVMAVSSVHSPGAKPPRPPPIMPIGWFAAGYVNS